MSTVKLASRRTALVKYQNGMQVSSNYENYPRLQSIVLYPYGVIKRQWKIDDLTTKNSIKHASVDVRLIFIAYNLKRIFNKYVEKVPKMYGVVLLGSYGRF